LHWAIQDGKVAAAKKEQAAVEMGLDEGVKADQVAGVNGQGGGGANGAVPVAGKLRHGKKRDIGQRLGGN
jgi:hypothetical protein